MSAAQTVSVSPGTAQVNTGASQQFSATVTGASNPIVLWSLSGAGCMGVTCGTISGSGVYTAPKTAPNPAVVTVTATSLANASASGSATVQLVAPTAVTITVSPAVETVSPGTQQVFTAAVTGTSNKAVYWYASGPACYTGSCGSVDANGVYTAPASIPSPPTVSIVATLQSDFSKTGSAQVTIAPAVAVTVVPASVQLLIGNQQQFTAQVSGTSNSIVKWSVSGPGCTGAACGSITSGGLYTAPATAPTPASITISATSAADSTKSGGAAVQLVSSVAVTVTPPSVHVNPTAQQQFSASVAGSSNQTVTWALSGSGCSGATCGAINSSGLYTAPSAIPAPNSVTVTATSSVDTTKSGTATVYVGSGSPVKITVAPGSATVPVNLTQQFTATVTGSSNTAVKWNLTGIGCGGPSCGSIDSTGLYTAPAVAPIPSQVTVTATALADSTRTASATVTVASNTQISISPTTALLAPGQHTQFTASVTGTTNKNVTWSMSGTNCSGITCGTLTQAGLYTAPASISQTLQITIKVVPLADQTKSATAAVTVAVPVVISVTPKTVQVAVNGTQQFVANASGATGLKYNWSVSCAGSCGSIDNTGTYTAPATVPTSAVTVTATSQSNANNSGSATVTVIATNNVKLNGRYAFLFRGTDSSGVYHAAGSFTADGKGNITNGLEDINRFTGPVNDLSFTGKYTVGADYRGTMTVTSSQGTFSYAFALTQSGAIARYIETDASGIRGGGVIKQQNPTAFNTGSITGGYTVSMVGQDSRGQRLGALANLFPSGFGTISGSAMDINDGGNTVPTFTRFSGADKIASTGRGTASLTLSGFEGGSFHFALYVVSAGEFFLISTDQLSFEAPIWSGDALLQAGSPFSNASFDGASVFYHAGWGSTAPDVWVGRFTFDGSGNSALQFDENNGGTISISNVMIGSYSTSPNGRTSVKMTNVATNQAYTAILYAISQNTAFIMDMSPFVHVGYMEEQTIVPPFEDNDLVGAFTYGTSSPIGASTPFHTGTLVFDGNGKLMGNQDTDLEAGKKLNQLATGTFSISPSSSTGRGTIQMNLPVKDSIATWLATYQRAYGLPVAANDTEPEVIVYEQ